MSMTVISFRKGTCVDPKCLTHPVTHQQAASTQHGAARPIGPLTIQFSHLEGRLELGFLWRPGAAADCSQPFFLFSPIFSPLKELFIFVFLNVDNKILDVLSRKKLAHMICGIYGPTIPRDSCQSCQPPPLRTPPDPPVLAHHLPLTLNPSGRIAHHLYPR